MIAILIIAVLIFVVIGFAIFAAIFDDDREGLPNDQVDEHEQDHWDAQGKPMSKFPIDREGQE